ncbi:saccharopine dehydrogenase [Capsaspora owczarzaki ATCC 30864]|uniref:Saccharopine dehydrogenase n=1 Tax=Capsaspora owczarzaki (strain ATCC 30864) TaxID=595528 RepID=A0A0D2WU22_CAPO3|nr:saccharopine dehydrogenase [Capsaspora owczarzaki ATCC 30864]KJE95298.1 saccharopine dehydrogenase [Capsaspora owczarzaki ATCC 30864]|eukprot:XP_004346436.1 saccharopine dehydrogenase [Capsaspora owczarzaki ATCC 30864]
MSTTRKSFAQAASRTGRAPRELEVLVFGATGFTGTLVARYLAERLPAGSKWGIAGRDAAKLNKVKSELIALRGSCAEDVVVVDGVDVESELSIKAATARTWVLLNCVGPFIAYGIPVVRSCIETHTDYVDITGEPRFVSAVVEQFHQRATEADVLIVPCCGFDSIPADLGVWYTLQLPGCIDAATQTSRVQSVKTVIAARANLSNGTFTTAIEAVGMSQLSDLRQLMQAWYNSGSLSQFLFPPAANAPRFSIQYMRAVKDWVMPLPVIDTAIVRRSWELTPKASGSSTTNVASPYPSPFYYGQYYQMRGFKSVLKLVLFFPILLLLTVVARFPGGRAYLQRFGPKQRQGPSEERRKRSWFKSQVIAYDAKGAVLAQGVVSGGDPGYTETAKMLSECALLLAHHRYELPLRAGVATTASAFGNHLVSSLSAAGIKFEDVTGKDPTSAAKRQS